MTMNKDCRLSFGYNLNLKSMKSHSKNSRPSNWDKHSKKQKGPSNNKKYDLFSFFLGKNTGRNKNR